MGWDWMGCVWMRSGVAIVSVAKQVIIFIIIYIEGV